MVEMALQALNSVMAIILAYLLAIVYSLWRVFLKVKVVLLPARLDLDNPPLGIIAKGQGSIREALVYVER